MTDPDNLIEAVGRLSERDREQLGELIWAYDRAAKHGFFQKRLTPPDYTWDGVSYYDGVAPIDCGGTNGSDHSYRLSKLVKLGLAEHRKGVTWGRSSTRHKGSKKYRPTDLGRAVWDTLLASMKDPGNG